MPSAPGYIRVTRPSGHFLRGLFALIINTTSPTRMFFTRECHFFLSFNVGRYSFINRRQKWSTIACTRRQRLLEIKSASCETNGAEFGRLRPRSRLLGVKTSGSLGSPLTNVSGRPLSRFSTRIRAELRDSSVKVWPWRTWMRARLADLTSRSQEPPKCGADGGLNCHFVPFRYNFAAKVAWSRLFRQSRSSRSAPTKFVPLSMNYELGTPSLLSKFASAVRNESVDMLCATSKCTARVTMHVNKQPQRFTRRRNTMTSIGPK